MNIKHIILVFFLIASDSVAQMPCTFDTVSSCYVLETFNPMEFGMEIKHQVDDSFISSINFNIGDIDQDCSGEIFGGYGMTKLNIIDFGNVRISKSLESYIGSWSRFFTSNYVVGLVDGEMRIFFAVLWGSGSILYNGKIICMDLDGTVQWVSNAEYHNPLVAPRRDFVPTLGLADFNQDGYVELYSGNRIFNAHTGVLLCTGGRNGVGANWRISNSVAADLDDDSGDLELAAGYTIYDVILNNSVDSSGNFMTPYNIEIEGNYYDGRTAIADIDEDGTLDVIVNFGNNRLRNPFAYVYTYNNGMPMLMAQVDWPIPARRGERGASTPAIGRVISKDKNHILLLIAFELRCYEYDGSNVLKEVWRIPIPDETHAGITPVLFDFDGDGVQEIVVNSQERLRVIDGSTVQPKILANVSCYSLTQTDNPVIGNVLGDEAAEICVFCTDTFESHGPLTIFGSPDSLGPWAPAPPTWNQYSYHPLSINDDLTVPQFQKNKATYERGRYNNFMAQRTLLDSNGMYRKRAASLFGEIDCIDYDIEENEYTVTFSVHNNLEASLIGQKGLDIVFYNGNPQAGGVIIGTYTTASQIGAGEGLFGLTYTFTVNNLTALFMVVNSSGADFSTIERDDFGILECDYFDNFSQSVEVPEVVGVKDSICKGEDYLFLDTTVTNEGIYYRTILNSSGCDSLVARLDLRIRDSIHIIEHVESCDSYLWRGRIYTESGRYSEVYSVQDGCDSTVTLDLTIHSSTLDTLQMAACDSFIWQGQVIVKSGYYPFRARTSEGCDSIIVLDLRFSYSTVSYQQLISCLPYVWKGQRYNQTGLYRFDTINKMGCDSTMLLELKIRDTIFSKEEIQICRGDSIEVFGQKVYEEGIFQREFKSREGCDSVHIVEIFANEVYRDYRQVGFCEGDSVYVIDRWISQPGTYEIIRVSTQNCDSIISILAEGFPVINHFDTVELCRGDTLLFFNQLVMNAGDWKETIVSHNGCDSTIHVHVDMLEPSTAMISFTICPEDSILIEGRWITGPETIIQMLRRENGCDSMVVVEIEQLETPMEPTYKINCETGNIEVEVEAGNAWSIEWDNGSRLHKTTYPGSNTVVVDLTAAPNCQVTYRIVLPEAPDWSEIPIISDTTVAYGSEWKIGLDVDSNEWKVEWWPKEMVDCDTCFEVTIKAVKEGQITIIFTHQSGCSIERSFGIQLEESGVYIPNVFTPNGDNINDFWQILHTDNVTVEMIQVYDRWGELVFDSRVAGTMRWDGFFNGSVARPGVYTYVAIYRESGESVTKSGDITVVW